jgi:signal transduction histidine kinase
VFDSETTTGPDIGLALQIVRTQVESQGWRVAVDSAEGGTTFRVTGAETNPNEESEMAL